MGKYLNILKDYMQRKKPDEEPITVETSVKYEDLQLEEIQKRLEEKYFPELKGKVGLVYFPGSFIIEISTNCNIFGYKPAVKIGPIGVSKLAGLSDDAKEGALAHEYGHITDINKKGLYGIIKRAYRKMLYAKSDNFEKKLKYEMRTDIEAAKRGCGKQVLELLKDFKEDNIRNQGRDPFESSEFALKQLNPRIKNLEDYLGSS